MDGWMDGRIDGWIDRYRGRVLRYLRRIWDGSIQNGLSSKKYKKTEFEVLEVHFAQPLEDARDAQKVVKSARTRDHAHAHAHARARAHTHTHIQHAHSMHTHMGAHLQQGTGSTPTESKECGS